MATLTGTLNFEGGYGLTTLNGIGGTVTASGTIPTPDLTWESGNSTGQANEVFAANFSIGSGNTTTFDLKGGGGEQNILNDALSMTTVKEVNIVVTGPVVGKQLTFGPQGVANGCPLWFGNTTTGNEVIRDAFLQVDRNTGWAVGNTTKVLALTNSGNVTIAGQLLVCGLN